MLDMIQKIIENIFALFVCNHTKLAVIEKSMYFAIWPSGHWRTNTCAVCALCVSKMKINLAQCFVLQ